jgi:hypothetical protein
MDIDAKPIPPIDDLVKRYEDEVYFSDERAAAKYAFALAIRFRDVGQFEEARQYARRSLHYAERAASNTLDDVTSDELSIGGVPMPERFHDGVVRSRLAGLLTD